MSAGSDSVAGVHTAGPWRVDPDANCDIQNADGSLEIASTHPDVINGGPTDPSKARANAALIASAPELLEALEAIMPTWEAYTDPDADMPGWPDDAVAVMNDAWKNGFYDKARAALAKARSTT